MLLLLVLWLRNKKKHAAHRNPVCRPVSFIVDTAQTIFNNFRCNCKKKCKCVIFAAIFRALNCGKRTILFGKSMTFSHKTTECRHGWGGTPVHKNSFQTMLDNHSLSARGKAEAVNGLQIPGKCLLRRALFHLRTAGDLTLCL